MYRNVDNPTGRGFVVVVSQRQLSTHLTCDDGCGDLRVGRGSFPDTGEKARPRSPWQAGWMAVHQPATIVPGKLELLQTWVPRQPWAEGADTTALSRLGSYRFDDPDGEVEMETYLLGTGDGQVLQVPLTYRGAPLAGAGHALVTMMTHTVLGDRWVYDGCHDPVYATALATVILTGGREADLFAATDEGLVLEVATTHVRGSGSSPSADVPDLQVPVVTHDGTTTRVDAGVALMLLRVPTTGPAAGTGGLVLTGTWPGQQAPRLLVSISGGP